MSAQDASAWHQDPASPRIWTRTVEGATLVAEQKPLGWQGCMYQGARASFGPYRTGREAAQEWADQELRRSGGEPRWPEGSARPARWRPAKRKTCRRTSTWRAG